MTVFVVYRIALGVALIGLSVAGVLGTKPTAPSNDPPSTVQPTALVDQP
jgi:hypothetical protein